VIVVDPEDPVVAFEFVDLGCMLLDDALVLFLDLLELGCQPLLPVLFFLDPPGEGWDVAGGHVLLFFLEQPGDDRVLVVELSLELADDGMALGQHPAHLALLGLPVTLLASGVLLAVGLSLLPELAH
jgi:hypothetical protein